MTNWDDEVQLNGNSGTSREIESSAPTSLFGYLRIVGRGHPDLAFVIDRRRRVAQSLVQVFQFKVGVVCQ